ncbi:MAG: hypothetical protein AAFY38_00565 [Pseudomonadota bacterium]
MAVALAVMAGPAVAQSEIAKACAFMQECFEAEGCTETDYTPALTWQVGADELLVEAQFDSPSETITLIGVASDGALSLAGGSFAARHLLTVAADGAARYTVHYADGPMVISYLGVCR